MLPVCAIFVYFFNCKLVSCSNNSSFPHEILKWRVLILQQTMQIIHHACISICAVHSIFSLVMATCRTHIQLDCSWYKSFMYFNAQLQFPGSKWNSHKPIYFHLICESAKLFVNNVFKKINFLENRFFKSCPICHLQLNGKHTWAAYCFYWLSLSWFLTIAYTLYLDAGTLSNLEQICEQP